VATEGRGPVRVLTLERPEVLNAFDTALYRATAAALDAARDDDDVHVVVLTGAGRAFSSGQDLGEMARLATGEQSGSGFPALLDALEAFDKPLVAAVNGAAIGIGFTLLPHCDLVLVADTARCVLFPERMGAQQAARVLFTSAWLSAEEAVDLGIALRVVPAADLLDEALALAGQVAANPLPALRAIKGALLAGRNAAVTAARRYEDQAFAAVLGLG
jgi:enoyl-CoA hydratase/carnithine racemase